MTEPAASPAPFPVGVALELNGDWDVRACFDNNGIPAEAKNTHENTLYKYMALRSTGAFAIYYDAVFCRLPAALPCS